MMRLPKMLSLLLSALCLTIFLFFNTPDVQAAATYTDVFYSSNPGLTTQCIDRSGCDRPAECWNSQAAGVTDCGPACTGGDPWTKYRYLGCFQRSYDPEEQIEDCVRAFQETQEAVCSTADKCTSGGPYLNSGRCDCSVGSQYKTCCTNATPSLVSGNSCVQIAVDETNPPWEGVCPAGSRAVFCGFGGYPPCGQAACGPTGPTGPVCGNGTCEAGEDYNNCPQDCPAPLICGAACVYSQADASGNVTCHSGNCTDGSQNCSFNSNCSYVPGCSSGATVSCPAGPPPPPPAPDTQAPTCNNLALSATHGCPGQRVTMTGSTSDNVEVTNMEFFKNPSSLASFNNSLHSNPFIKSYEWDTSGLAQGNYTIVVNASDAAGNVMRGLETSCNKQYTVDSQSQCQAPWISPSCSGSTFVGCHRQGQAVCTDYGTPCSLIKKSPEFFKSF